MRLPSFTPMNQPQEQKAVYLPIEEDILLAHKQIAEAESKYTATKSITDKINLEEARTRLDILIKDRDAAASNEPEMARVSESPNMPIAELEEVRKKIASAERGIELANTLNDMERMAKMMENLQKFRAEEQAIQNRLNEVAANASAFDEATSREQIFKQEEKQA